MQADTGYDTTRFQALRRELGALNEKAITDGLIAVRDGVVMTASTPKRAARKVAAAGKGKVSTARKSKAQDRTPAAAASLLDVLHRRDGDDSPDVPGTSFTENGIVRLLGSLRRRNSRGGSGAWSRFLQHAQRHLGQPVAFGMRTVRGVGVERVQVFARQLEDIEARGWAGFVEARDVRRRKVAPALPLTRATARAEPPQAEPAKPRRKGKSP